MFAKRHWAFRVASRPQDGWGHLMRCRSLAQAMNGAAISFFLDPNPVWEAKLRASGYSVQVEPSPREAVMMRRFPAETGGYLFDGYEFAYAIRHTVMTGFTAEIVDFPGEFNSHLIIAPGLGAEKLSFSVRSRVAGSRYALLRPEFAQAHEAAIAAQKGPVRHLLVSFGGRDSGNATGLALDAIALLPNAPKVTVVLTADAPHRPEIEERAGSCGASVFIDVEDMASLYCSADLAVGGGGVSLLERMCCGLPSLIVVQSENQMANALAAEAAGAARVVELGKRFDPATVATELQRLIEDHAARAGLRTRGLALVDGRGAERVAKVLDEAVTRHHVNSVSL